MRKKSRLSHLESWAAMEKVYETYHEPGFEIVAVNIAETGVAVSFFSQQLGLTFPIWMDQDREVMQLYGVARSQLLFLSTPPASSAERSEALWIKVG